MATDDEQARKDARWVRYQAESRRTMAKVQLVISAIWIVVAIVSWAANERDVWLRWLWTALALLALVNGYVQWRVLRRPLPPIPGQHEGPGR